jgi:hypothetical protein
VFVSLVVDGGMGIMVRIVSCGVRECKQADRNRWIRERERETEISQTREERKENHIIEQNTYSMGCPSCLCSLKAFPASFPSLLSPEAPGRVVKKKGRPLPPK